MIRIGVAAGLLLAASASAMAAQAPAATAETSAELASLSTFVRWVQEQAGLDFTRLRLGRDTFEVALRRGLAGQSQFKQETQAAEHKLMVDREGNAYLTLQKISGGQRQALFLYQKHFFQMAEGQVRSIPSLGLYFDRLVLPYSGFFATLAEADPPTVSVRLEKESSCDRLRFEASRKASERLRRYRGWLCLKPGTRQVQRGELIWNEEGAADKVATALTLNLQLRELGREFRLVPPGMAPAARKASAPAVKGKTKKR